MSDGPGRDPTITDDEILDVFRSSSDPVFTAAELASELPIGRRGILDRLKDLEADGILKSKKVGGRSKIWWYPGHTSTSSTKTPSEEDPN